jgi:hypothetical protein
MGYHEIILLPATGHFGKGNYDPGPNYGTFFELDIARDLIQYIAEELDNDGVRVRVLELWKAPGLTRKECGLETNATAISMHVAFGRGKVPGDRRNQTKTWVSDNGALWLAKLLTESVSEWAKCSNFHHSVSPPKLQEAFFPHHAVLLEPFDLAVGDYTPYLSRLKDLGRSIAGTLRDFFMRSNQAMRLRPHSPWTDRKSEDKLLVSDFLRAVDIGQLIPFTVEQDDDTQKGGAKHKRKAVKPEVPVKHSLPPAAELPKTGDDSGPLLAPETAALAGQTAG